MTTNRGLIKRFGIVILAIILLTTVSFLVWNIQKNELLKNEIDRLKDEKAKAELELTGTIKSEEYQKSLDPCGEEIIKAKDTDYAVSWHDYPTKLVLCRKNKDGVYKETESDWVRVENGFFTSFYRYWEEGFQNFVFDLENQELRAVMNDKDDVLLSYTGVQGGFFTNIDPVSPSKQWILVNQSDCLECATYPILMAYNVSDNRLVEIGLPMDSNYEWIGPNVVKWEEMEILDKPDETDWPVTVVSLGTKTKVLN